MTHGLLQESSGKKQRRIKSSKSDSSSVQSFQTRSHPIAQLQRTLGNRQVAKLIQAKQLTTQGQIIGLQRKLTVGAADDQYEKEADQVARQVMNTPDAAVAGSMQRDISSEEEKDEMLQTKPLAASITPFVQREMTIVDDEDKRDSIQTKSAISMSGSFEAGDNTENQLSQSKGQGSPLPDPVRSFMEPRFGVDFSQVRVHTGSDAIQMNRGVGAQAFTHGSDVYFGEGRSPTNLELTAHELTHVVQQSGERGFVSAKAMKNVVYPLSRPRFCSNRGRSLSMRRSFSARKTAAAKEQRICALHFQTRMVTGPKKNGCARCDRNRGGATHGCWLSGRKAGPSGYCTR